MDEFWWRRKGKRLVLLSGAGLIVVGLLVFIFSLFTRPKLVSPVPETDNVRIIFVTPEPDSSAVQTGSSASPSASTKSESKTSPTPKATIKPSPKATNTPSPEATASAKAVE